MGTAFVSFLAENRENQSHRLEKNITLEIGKIVFRSIIEEMEREKLDDLDWKGSLDASYAIKWLYVGADREKFPVDFGPAFFNALRRLKIKGPPNYYPQSDIVLFYEQIDQLIDQYTHIRLLSE